MKYDKKRGCSKVPYSVNISVTERCPLRCPSCFQPFEERQELSPKTVIKYIDELSNLGTKLIVFSGGEPLGYKYLFDVIKHASEKGMITRISTSGAGLTEKLAYQLQKSGLDFCHVSMNGSTSNIHGMTRDGFHYSIRALQLLSKTGLKTAINWVANHENVSDLPDLINLAQSYNVKYISLLSSKMSNSGEIVYPLTKEDLRLLGELWNENKEYLVVESCFYQLRSIIKQDKLNYIEDGCRAGRFYMAINARNEFQPCPHVEKCSIDHMSIWDYWDKDEDLNSVRENMKECYKTSLRNNLDIPYLCEFSTFDKKEHYIKVNPSINEEGK